MARGNFRTGRFDCLYCGKHGLTVPRGQANNPEYLCLDCAGKYDAAIGKKIDPPPLKSFPDFVKRD